MRSLSLCLSSPAAGDVQLSAMGGQRGQRRQLVDESRHVGGPDREPLVAAVADPDGAAALAGVLGDLQQVDAGACAFEPGENPGPGGI